LDKIHYNLIDCSTEKPFLTTKDTTGTKFFKVIAH
jgi:hypothetical protein